MIKLISFCKKIYSTLLFDQEHRDKELSISSMLDVKKLETEPLKGSLDELENLHIEDVQLIGTYIQIYNFIEFNLRRAVELFIEAGFLLRPKSIPTCNLAELVKEGIEKMDISDDDIKIAIDNLTEIEFRRNIRNLLAH